MLKGSCNEIKRMKIIQRHQLNTYTLKKKSHALSICWEKGKYSHDINWRLVMLSIAEKHYL